MKNNSFNIKRRNLLKYSFMGLSAFVGSSLFLAPMKAASLSRASLGRLQPPDRNGVRLPKGFTSRIVASSGQNLFGYKWHSAPDGGATFATDNGGWIYVSNSELEDNAGGVGALRFNQQGELMDAYSILKNTTRNCAGGHTPWQTWLSCEEIDKGQVWECDPFGKNAPQPRNALGLFRHEAIAIDTENKQLYLTEDQPDGCLYRYTARSFNAAGYPNLDDGFLEIAETIDGHTKELRWHSLPDPLAITIPTRKQVAKSTPFNGGEGIWYHQGIVYFTTKGDDRVWSYDTRNNNLNIIYNAALYFCPVLTGVDNITANASGKLLVAEDNGNMQIVVIAGDEVHPLLQIIGHDRSEITGPAFSPDGSRLYFSSQRGRTGHSEDGMTFEITGPF
ncbi:WD40-like Beta Propeller Repeat [Nitrosomonas cryotolerans]|uniref:WD40-like Beta Propeller Repeat n=1 Tax=Nitrosomonas cryotolerans ATCC 49181 TaxID=1131553 RepID=A0A1N6FRK9_9PROT|nr:alkaline phosphatase PhoX [Nitrosomonas cryotolerans]SFP94122.1 WD40-like Beta Propeller Repeat [Nitrosomonas cryotolerans]SIN97949.1 WD40-like Beta Propeller Repeat [Nitrosomonas cryotolerans ATCC 49181]